MCFGHSTRATRMAENRCTFKCPRDPKTGTTRVIFPLAWYEKMTNFTAQNPKKRSFEGKHLITNGSYYLLDTEKIANGSDVHDRNRNL